MFCSFSGAILYSEVIDHKGEGSSVCGVPKEARSSCFVIVVLREVIDETLLSEVSGLGQAIHTLFDFKED